MSTHRFIQTPDILPAPRMHVVSRGVEQAEALRVGPVCPVCQSPSVVFIESKSAYFRMHRCATDGRATIAALRAEGHTDVRIEWIGVNVIAVGVSVRDYVRETFEGVVGDAPLPFATQDDARLAIESALTSRAFRPLRDDECAVVGIGVEIEWRRQEQLARAAQLRERREWLQEFREGRR